ncbi:terminase large subunit [Jeongeupia sp. USM3]|uniref:terminase large subunit n=1 Tax=Jeongeupia sp. USM3 TaxID=1906741 RepID=UPI00196ABC6B|nr:terminase TerL endonuclease subunit [Jeongeupia sp. USM3]
MRLAVERHYRDLRTAGERGLIFRGDMADHVLSFFPRFCRHSKGHWAGQPVTLAPWQAFWLAVEFGWYRDTGVRRFRTWYEEVARKNGKSTKLAGLGIYLFAADREPGAEVYTAATKLDQAKITHAEAEMMVGQSPALRQLITSRHNKLFIAGTSNKYLPLGADAKTQDGLNVHAAIVDELHAHPNRDLWDVIDTARGSRRNSIMHAITTAGFNQEGSICLEQRQYLISILDGALDDDSFGGVIYTLDADDDWRDEAVWPKANPNLGVSVFLDELRDQARKAAGVPAALFNFLTKRLNIWTQQVEAWLSLDDWDKGAEPFDEALLHGRKCYGGLDLASTTDLTAWVLVFLPTESDPHWRVLCRFFVPEDNMQLRERKDRVPYQLWAKQGHLIATPGNVVDQELIRQQILADGDLFDLQEVAFDQWNAAKLATELGEAGITLVAIPQNFGGLSAPTKHLEGLVLSGALLHGGHPVLRWNAGNVVLLRDTNDNYRPNKKKSRDRIDGIVAVIMAMNRALFGVEEAESFWES